MPIDATEHVNLMRVIIDQTRRHSAMAARDFYKLFYQMTHGPAHLLKDRDRAFQHLKEEWANTEKIPKGEVMLEIIDPRAEVLRVNYRLYKKTGGSVDRLFDAMVKSAEMFRPDQERLFRYWTAFRGMAEERQVDVSPASLDQVWGKMEAEGFPPVSHSDAYVEANRPAYRVVCKSCWEAFQS